MTVTQERRVTGAEFARLVERNALHQRMVTAGDRLPIEPLVEVDLGPIHLDRLLRTGPVVLLFIRHAGSSACGAALTAYRTGLAPSLAARDAHLVAVSPQAPRRLAALKHRYDFDFLVASDPRHRLIDALNIGFAAPGADIQLGTRRNVLPFAAAIVADRAGVVRFADVRPDWSTPIAPDRIVAALA
ncbi:redoxin domain-containing protein [Actinoplanes sp. NPDC049265]|uniref:redoxin domain-containing protein n=1 Tax=Actinoplanes sp. NPDC049265 TaxID=3363902 RepID=UPI0037106DFB